jgi:hypothetical protein
MAIKIERHKLRRTERNNGQTKENNCYIDGAKYTKLISFLEQTVLALEKKCESAKTSMSKIAHITCK